MSSPSSHPDSQIRHVPPKITGSQNDLEVASKSLLQGEKAILQVIDAPYDGTTPQLRAVFSLSDDIAEGLKSLESHRSGTARILDVTTCSDFNITGLSDTKSPETTRPAGDVLIKFLQDTYTQPFEERRVFGWLHDPLLENDIGSISSQWSQRLGGGKANFDRLVNRTSLQQDPWDYDLHPRDSYLTCAQDANGRLIAIIVNDVWSGQTFHMNKSRNNDILFENPRSISRILDGTSWTSLSDGSVDTFAKLLVLDFFLASIYLQRVDYYWPLIYSQLPQNEFLKVSLTKNPHLRVPLGLFEPRLFVKGKEAFKEMEHAEGIIRSIDNLVDSIQFVVAALNPTYATGPQRPVDKDFVKRMQELQELCLERRGNVQRVLEALKRQLDCPTKWQAFLDSRAFTILSILAALYLPLSLSGWVPGLQNPFKPAAHTKPLSDQDVLFDIFGVFYGLFTTALGFVHLIRFGIWLKSEGLGIISKIF